MGILGFEFLSKKHVLFTSQILRYLQQNKSLPRGSSLQQLEPDVLPSYTISPQAHYLNKAYKKLLLQITYMDSTILQKIKELELERTSWNVTEENMNIMLNYCRQNDLHRLLEIGSFNGYSALNFALICEEVISLEIEEKRFMEATNNCQIAKNIKIILADANEYMKQLITKKELFDAILIDGNNSQYSNYLTLAIPLIKDTGMIFIDNTVSHKDRLEKKGFFETLQKSNLSFKELNTTKGLIVAFKTRKFYAAQNSSKN
mgnify:CR=1 FL=1